MQSMKSTVLLLAGALALSPCLAAQEEAETQPAAAQATTQDDTFLDVVTVTATKREESLQDVPIAVTAVSELQMERSGLKDIRDLPLLATSFNMNSTQTESQGSTLRIRGVGTTGNNIGLESSVGVFIDGTYLSRPGVALGDQLDLEAIEVLRGPQGTLFGRNVSAGALNIRTKRPSLSRTDVFTNFGVGDFGAYNAQLGVTGPFSDSVGYRLSGAIRSQDGFVENTTGGESLNRDRYLLRGQLLFQLNDSASLRLIGDYSDADEQCCDAINLVESPAVALGSFSAAGLPANGGVLRTGDSAFEDRISNGEQFENPFDQTGFSAELNVDFGRSSTLTYIGSYREFFAGSVQNDFVGIKVYEVSPQEAAGFDTFDEIESSSHELRIAGDSDSLSWMLGGYYSDEDILEEVGFGLGTDFTAHMDAVLWNFAFGPVLGAAPLLGKVPLATGGTFADVLGADNQALAFAGGVDSASAFAQNVFRQQGESTSIFTHNTWRVSDSFSLVGGARYVEETKEGSFNQLGASNNACLRTLANAGALAAGAAGTGLEVVAGTIGNFSVGFSCFPFATPALGISVLPAEFSDKFEDEELVYTGKAVVEFTDKASAYASYTRGFKSGGFNLDSTAAAGGGDPRFASEKVDSIEIGFKSEFANRRARLNITAFDYDIEDFQVLEFTGVQFVTFNVPTAESQGLELELAARLGNSLRANFGYTYADSS